MSHGTPDRSFRSQIGDGKGGARIRALTQERGRWGHQARGDVGENSGGVGTGESRWAGGSSAGSSSRWVGGIKRGQQGQMVGN